MDHGQSTDWGEDLAAGYKTRLGLWMFLAYGIVYGGFVAINSMWPNMMAAPLGKLNMAIVYGFSLIGLALIMALLYNYFSCRADEHYASLFGDETPSCASPDTESAL